MPTPISTSAAPRPGGHYSQAIVHGGVVYVAGQLPVDPSGGRVLAGESAATQTERALENLRAVLEAAGSGLDLVLKVTVYVADVGLWAEINAACARAFGAHRPARSVVPTGPLHHGVLVEVDAVAAVRA
ncbi:MAG: RidA family protein [Acidobacteriota bacterium]